MKETEIEILIGDLTCDNVIACQKARRKLVSLGRDAVPHLIKELGNRKHWVRWEAAKALSQIADPSAIEALIKALEDKEFDVRWLAAEGLINIGNASIVPLLRALLNNPQSVMLQEGVHHVVSDIYDNDMKGLLQPVVRAIESLNPTVEMPFAIKKALDLLENRS